MPPKATKSSRGASTTITAPEVIPVVQPINVFRLSFKITTTEEFKTLKGFTTEKLVQEEDQLVSTSLTIEQLHTKYEDLIEAVLDSQPNPGIVQVELIQVTALAPHSVLKPVTV